MQDVPARQLTDRKGLAKFVEHFESLCKLHVVAQHFLGRVITAHAGRDVVCVDEAALPVLDGDALGDARQNRGKLVA